MTVKNSGNTHIFRYISPATKDEGIKTAGGSYFYMGEDAVKGDNEASRID